MYDTCRAIAGSRRSVGRSNGARRRTGGRPDPAYPGDLRAAVLELVAERDWPEISIVDLTRRARVSRPTFYLHYSSLDELVVDALIERLRESAGGAGDTTVAEESVPEWLVSFLGEVNANRVVYRRLVGARSIAGIARQMVAAKLVRSQPVGQEPENSPGVELGELLGIRSRGLRLNDPLHGDRDGGGGVVRRAAALGDDSRDVRLIRTGAVTVTPPHPRYITRFRTHHRCGEDLPGHVCFGSGRFGAGSTRQSVTIVGSSHTRSSNYSRPRLAAQARRPGR